MPASLSRDARPRFRSAITTGIVIMITVMIVRDILARRWGGSAAPASDVQAIPVAHEGLHAAAKSP
ncbi:hypothetical protein GWE18_35720 [Bradyrhizobium sp. CSA112]|uniref:hypothetical protein n=1 Tax=Bradyrhizobium sp. CSA112 TaxID=2699170 RepID=UPI0023B0D90B|nr:hypothetical protein [Bradyrhizobium sp. CSA112]MDE5458069.1 hypothetical protein [Bradyrhizobium sp. CSA112]